MRFQLSLLLVALVLVGALTVCNSTETQARSATTKSPNSPDTQPQQSAPTDNVHRISIADARAEFENHKAVIIDVRGDFAYKQGHIKGAQSIALSELAGRAGELPKDKHIILYCSCPAEHSSVMAAQNLHAKGVDNTAALVGGYPAWKAAGYPVEGEAP
jgi:rhodanese-related sulfurtransferase